MSTRTNLRKLLLVVGYTVPMLILFTPGNIPVRFLEPIGIDEGNRWVADLILLVACPALVWLAQVHDGPAIRSFVSATIRRSSSREPFVAFTVEELSAVTSDFVGRGGFGVVYATAHRTAHLQGELFLPVAPRSPTVAATARAVASSRCHARGAVRSSGFIAARRPHARRCVTRSACFPSATTRTCSLSWASALTAAPSASSIH